MSLENVTKERAEVLRSVYFKYVHHGDGHWKGAAIAVLPDKSLAPLVREAMDLMGSIVTKEGCLGGRYTLLSEGDTNG